ncbi:MAG: hypothetical protein R3C11_04605 [Planctomycetaceae bacterium]
MPLLACPAVLFERMIVVASIQKQQRDDSEQYTQPLVRNLIVDEYLIQSKHNMQSALLDEPAVAPGLNLTCQLTFNKVFPTEMNPDE